MNVGGFRHRIKVQRVASSQNSLGEREESWSKHFEMWAKVEPLQGREYWNAKQDVSEVTTKITIRYHEGIIPAMRIIKGSQIYDIESIINPNNANRELQLMCKQVNA